MSVYRQARETLAQIEKEAGDSSADRAVEAMLVIAIERLAALGGAERARETLTYELSNLNGTVDTVFLRSR